MIASSKTKPYEIGRMVVGNDCNKKICYMTEGDAKYLVKYTDCGIIYECINPPYPLSADIRFPNDMEKQRLYEHIMMSIYIIYKNDLWDKMLPKFIAHNNNVCLFVSDSICRRILIDMSWSCIEIDRKLTDLIIAHKEMENAKKVKSEKLLKGYS